MRPVSDHDYMLMALRMAMRGQGLTAPNPSVGCVIVKQGRVIGRGWTQPGGRPHAEVHALSQCSEKPVGATAYVTLEPCAHYGRTGPCTAALIKAGIHRVVLGARDPDIRVNGKGVQQLRMARVQVLDGIAVPACEASHAGFFSRLSRKRPFVTLKLAQSLDGRIATASGESQWITNAMSRQRGHRIRYDHDAIAVGIGTVEADDPSLTCRLEGVVDASPRRVIFDSRLKLSKDAQLVRTAGLVPVHVICGADHDPARARQLQDLGVHIHVAGADRHGRPDLSQALEHLTEVGVNRLMVEGGGTLAASFLRAHLVDCLHVFVAGKLIGADGLPSVRELALSHLAASDMFALESTHRLDDDVMMIYRKKGSD